MRERERERENRGKERETERISDRYVETWQLSRCMGSDKHTIYILYIYFPYAILYVGVDNFHRVYEGF